jgi:hypothetical protein
LNIGINIVGISSGRRSRNWINTSNSIKENIIDCWEGHAVSTYITTYEHSTVTQLLDYYKPKKHLIISLEDSDQRLTYKKSLEMLQDEELDFIISTRFDIGFFKPVSLISMDFNKFNFLFPENYEIKEFVCDTFFAFPKQHLSPFIESVQYMYDVPHRINCTDLHAACMVIRDKIENRIHMISNEPQYSNTNSFYTLHRD